MQNRALWTASSKYFAKISFKASPTVAKKVAPDQFENHLLGEMEHYYTRYSRPQYQEKTVLQMLQIIDGTGCQIVQDLLQVCTTHVISNATSERSFSALRRLKTWLRNRCGQERLTGLALMNIHPDIDISPEEVLTRFSRESARRIKLNV